jgi:hypothetical protein
MDPNRRFSEREVALVLRKATEIEETEGPSGGGLSLRELEQIAGEVGISPAMIQRAVAEVDAKKRSNNPLSRTSLSQEAIRAIGGELSAEGVAALVDAVERRSDQVGEVTQALGTTRWTARDRFSTTQVAITPSKDGTTVRVVERATARLRRVVHAVPAAFGVMAGSIVLRSPDPAGAMPLVALLGTAGLGLLAGRLFWTIRSASRAKRVEKLAEDLAREGGNLARLTAGGGAGDGDAGRG